MNEEQEYLNNKGLIYIALKTNRIYWKTPDEKQDYIDAGTDGLLKGIRTYDSNKGKKSTYYYACIEKEIYHFLSYKTRKKRQMKIVSLNLEIDDDKQELWEFIPDETNIEQEVIDKINDEKILNIIDTILSEKDRLIVKYHLGLNGYPTLTFEEIGKLYDNNKNAIRSRFLRSIRRVYYRWRKNGN